MANKPKYRALVTVSVREQNDRSCQDWLTWMPGETLDEYPDHTDIDNWLEIGAIEEIRDEAVSQRRRRKG